MLNPGCRWLDPDVETLARLASCAPAAAEPQAWQRAWEGMDKDLRRTVLAESVFLLEAPGVRTAADIDIALRAAAKTLGQNLPERFFWNWPWSLLRRILETYRSPEVVVLGILNGDGIWAGVLAGVAGGGLDFLTTPSRLWEDEPSLAARQQMSDLPEWCQRAARRYGRPAGGLFMYRDEFLIWRDRQWDPGFFQSCLDARTAVTQWPRTG